MFNVCWRRSYINKNRVFELEKKILEGDKNEQKAITAIENKKLLKNIKKNNNIKFIYKNIQYREAIIEILKKEKDIGIIFISEDIPGEISIEELINEIKLINKK